jgi:hypothetical protein
MRSPEQVPRTCDCAGQIFKAEHGPRLERDQVEVLSPGSVNEDKELGRRRVAVAGTNWQKFSKFSALVYFQIKSLCRGLFRI